mmetsp:Transcript_65790/g.183263  ORF Transcript_65790/g.183263 Transcript_65790/m.183263 type:complete len:257 (+) Transcript_65790:1024-1794(+)
MDPRHCAVQRGRGLGHVLVPPQAARQAPPHRLYDLQNVLAPNWVRRRRLVPTVADPRRLARARIVCVLGRPVLHVGYLLWCESQRQCRASGIPVCDVPPWILLLWLWLRRRLDLAPLDLHDPLFEGQIGDVRLELTVELDGAVSVKPSDCGGNAFLVGPVAHAGAREALRQHVGLEQALQLGACQILRDGCLVLGQVAERAHEKGDLQASPLPPALELHRALTVLRRSCGRQDSRHLGNDSSHPSTFPCLAARADT